jgi:hypothetical protein
MILNRESVPGVESLEFSLFLARRHMSKEDSNNPALKRQTRPTRQEFARKLRQEAYQRAKAQRAQDPRQIAMKEAVKVRRRELYQQVKERRKAVAKEQKVERKLKEREKQAEERTASDGELMKLVTGWMSKGSDSSN